MREQTTFNKNLKLTYSFSIQSTDDRVFYYLLVDSLKPIEILVSFSALVCWNDTGGKANAEKCIFIESQSGFGWKGP